MRMILHILLQHTSTSCYALCVLFGFCIYYITVQLQMWASGSEAAEEAHKKGLLFLEKAIKGQKGKLVQLHSCHYTYTLTSICTYFIPYMTILLAYMIYTISITNILFIKLCNYRCRAITIRIRCSTR